MSYSTPHPCCFIGDEASTGSIELPYSSPYTFTRLAWDLDNCTSWEPFQFHLLIKTQDANSKVDARKGTAFLKLCLKLILSSPKKFNYMCVCLCMHLYMYTCICIDVYIYRYTCVYMHIYRYTHIYKWAISMNIL